MSDKTELNRKIKAARLNARLTQTQMSEKLDISQGTYAQWENGRRRPNVSTISKIAKVLDLPITYFFESVPLAPLEAPEPSSGTYTKAQEAGSTREIEIHDIEQAALANIQYYLHLLNDKGKETAVERVKELAKIPDYQKGRH